MNNLKRSGKMFFSKLFRNNSRNQFNHLYGSFTPQGNKFFGKKFHKNFQSTIRNGFFSNNEVNRILKNEFSNFHDENDSTDEKHSEENEEIESKNTENQEFYPSKSNQFIPSYFYKLSIEEKIEWVEEEIKKNPMNKKELLVELYQHYQDKKIKETNEEKKEEIIEEFKLVSSPIGNVYFKRLVFLICAGFALLMFLAYQKKVNKKVTNFQEFIKYYNSNEIKKVLVHQEVVEVVLIDGRKLFFYTTGKKFAKKLKRFEDEINENAESRYFSVYYTSEKFVSPENLVITVSTIAVTILGILYLINLSSKYGMMGEQMGDVFGKRIRKIDNNLVDITFADVAGLKEQKKEIMEFVEFVKDFEKYNEIGSTLPRGCLLSGPPGTGKTMLAKALAGECEIPFYSISGSEFVEIIVGIGPQRVRNLFKKARENQPSIVFIDEIDAIGSKRGTGQFFSFLPERENTLNQLLVEMDGFNSEKMDNVVVIAATNRPHILDPALLRTGRFDRMIEVGLPNVEEREEIFELYLQKIKCSGEAHSFAKQLAKLAPGCSGADISNICNEAALIASRENEEGVDIIHFEKAIDKIISGLERTNHSQDEKEKNIIAYHEAGHALVGWLLENCDPVLKVTIVPRSSGVLGFTQHLPKDRIFMTEKQLKDSICMTLGGRVAEDILFHHFSTGAQNDLEKVTELSYSMISELGMNSKIGNVSFPKGYYMLNVEKPFSQETSEIIDEEVRALINEQYDRTFKLLSENRDKLDKIVELLLEYETISARDIQDAIGNPTHNDTEFNDYVMSLSTAQSKIKSKQ